MHLDNSKAVANSGTQCKECDYKKISINIKTGGIY